MNAGKIKVKLFYLYLSENPLNVKSRCEELNSFLSANTVLNLSQYPVYLNGLNYVVFVINYLDQQKVESKTYPKNSKLFLWMKSWRLEEAKKRGIAPYIICNDSTLIDILEINPQIPEDLFTIKGLNEEKIKNYGPLIVEKLKEFSRKENELK